jgi:ribonuclease Z
VSFTVTVLGSGAAIPTLHRNPSAQYVNCNERHILIDCGEGTQMQFRRFGLRFQRISHILISHLHGDHFFGLVGLLSTMHLMGRDKGVSIYGPKGLEDIVRKQLEIGGAKPQFEINFIDTNPNSVEVIFSDKLMEIVSFPLKHRIPTTGFLIREKIKERNIDKSAIQGIEIGIQAIHKLKRGEDVVLESGKLLRSVDCTIPPKNPRAYAYCSDTAYMSEVAEVIKNVNVLYHEATFCDKDAERAQVTFHSTAKQAALIAKNTNAGRLYLGHISARYSNVEGHLTESREIFLNTDVAEDGMVIEIT